MEIVDSNNYLKLTLINDENEFEHEVKVEFRNAISQFGKSIYFERIELDGLNEAFETKFIKRYTMLSFDQDFNLTTGIDLYSKRYLVRVNDLSDSIIDGNEYSSRFNQVFLTDIDKISWHLK